MNTSQADRDALRAAQHKMTPNFEIGNIIEHRSQDPIQYELLSSEHKHSCSQSKSGDASGVVYKNKYYNGKTKPTFQTNDKDISKLPLPFDVHDIQLKWLNMEHVEFDKLEWMTSEADKKYQEKMKASTLFDQNGKAIPHDKLTNVQGDPQEVKDINGLVNLLDSTYPAQVTYALNVVSRIANLANTGFYDGAFNENIHGVLITNCLLRVRRHMDNPNETICQSALKCMRSLLCNTRVDELMLDRIHPFTSSCTNPNMWLQKDREFDIDMKDSECVEVDAILALIRRTDILRRFFYLLETKSGTFSTLYQECILDILIRMARHSPEVCLRLNDKRLLKILIKLFLPVALTTSNSELRPLVVKALKLFRLLAHTQVELPQIEPTSCLIPEEIVEVIRSYFFIDCFNDHPNSLEPILKIHIETLRLIKIFIKLEKFRGDMLNIVSVGIGKLFTSFQQFNKLNIWKLSDSKMSFDWQYAAHLIDLTGVFLKLEKYHLVGSNQNGLWKIFVGPAVMKWMTEIVRERRIPHIDVSITIATAAQHYRNIVDAETNQALFDIMFNSVATIKVDGSKSSNDFFRILAKAACEGTQLRSFMKENGKLRDPGQLGSYGCLNFNTSQKLKYTLNPFLQFNTPYILLNTFICQLQHSNSPQYLKVFIDNLELIRYIRFTTSYLGLPLTYESLVQHSLLAQYEIEIIARSLLLLSQYYLSDIITPQLDIIDHESKRLVESDLKTCRFERYGNLNYYGIAIIGLLSAKWEVTLELRNLILEKILFTEHFQVKTTDERLNRKIDCPIEVDFIHEFDYLLGDRKYPTLNNKFILSPIYMGSKQYDRFWILKPLIDYYSAQTEDPDWPTKQKAGNWFKNSVTTQLMDSNDYEVISAILDFHFTMMLYSPSYYQFVVKPNMEDYLTSLGTIFLSDDLFLDEGVSRALARNFRFILTNNTKKTQSNSSSVPFTDGSRLLKPLNIPVAVFFTKLIEQYESVSYGDTAFSNFVLLFISPHSDKTLRKKLLQEKAETCLRLIRLPKEYLWTSMDFFLEPEKDPEVKALIAKLGSVVEEDSFLKLYVEWHTQ